MSSAVLTVKPKSDSVDKIMTKVNQVCRGIAIAPIYAPYIKSLFLLSLSLSLSLSVILRKFILLPLKDGKPYIVNV